MTQEVNQPSEASECPSCGKKTFYTRVYRKKGKKKYVYECFSCGHKEKRYDSVKE